MSTTEYKGHHEMKKSEKKGLNYEKNVQKNVGDNILYE